MDVDTAQQAISPEVWGFLDRMVQWMVLPLFAFWWSTYRNFTTQLSDHDRALLRLATMLDERSDHRRQERLEEAKTIADLREMFKDLRDEIKELRAEISAMRLK